MSTACPELAKREARVGRTITAAGITVLALLSTSLTVAATSAAAAQPSRVPADAATQTLGSAIWYSTTAPIGLPAPLAAAANQRNHFGHIFGHQQRPLHSAAIKPALTAPAPNGTPVSTSAGGATGFNGVSHYDQLLAGTGAYANTQFTLEPPDQGLCVGNGYVIEPVNTAFVVYNTHGTALTSVTVLNQFFNRSPEIDLTTTGDFLSDPKCYYDPIGKRWIQTILEIDAPGNFGGTPVNRTHVLIAVSKTANPTGSWNLYSLDTSDDGLNGTPAHTGCPCLPDQPLLGANADGIFIATNEFQDNSNFYFNGAQLYGIGLAGLERGVATIPVPHLNVGDVSTGDLGLPFWGSVQPSESISPQHGTELLMTGGPEDIFQNNAVLDNRIAVWSLSGTKSLNSVSPSLSLRHVVLTSETYGLPINTGATQKPGPTPLGTAVSGSLETINANDSRMNQVVNVGGVLYGGVNTTVVNPDSSTGVGIAYFSVAASATSDDLHAHLAHQGYVAVTGENVLFPSIAVNGSGAGAMAFTLSGPDYYPSAAYVRFAGGKTSGPIHISGAGTGPEDGFTGYAAFGGNGVSRWGDYSAAVAVGNTIWMANEFIPNTPRSTYANWGTFVSRISA